jgi:putative ABC transport system permease protein
MELFVRICVLLKGGGYKLDQVLLSRTLVMERSDNPTQRQGNPRTRVSLKEPMMIALETLRTHKLRSFLTLLGVILSVSTLIVVVSLVEGTNKYVADKVANFGANVYLILQYPIISSRETRLRLERTNRKITWEDYEYLRDSMRLADAVGLQVNGSGKAKYGSESIDGVDVRGVTANMGDIDIEEAAMGRYITDSDNEHRANVTMIGTEVAKRFFSGLDPLGRSIYIDGESFEVVGVAKEMGSAFGQSQDNFVYIPIQTYRKIHGSNDSMDINVKALSANLMQVSEDEARVLMRARRHTRPKDPDSFAINEPSALMDLWQSITGGLASGSIGVVLIFMVIGGIVIMNIMLASVTERTREIGVRKSVGATRRDVLLQFLVETGVMSAMGGVVGILVAVVISFVISSFTPFPMSLPFRWVVLAILIASAIGVFFGVYPAYKASKLDPIEALRFEI